VLLIVIGFLGFKLYKALTYYQDIPTKPGTEQVQKKEEIEVERKDESLPGDSFQIITAMDLFRPSRTPVVVSDDNSKKPIAPQTPPKLFGTIILDENKTAILEDPNTKTTKIYRINDSVAGYVVSKIFEDKVVLLSDGDEIEVRLRDEKGIKARKPVTPRKIQRRRQPRRRRTVPPPRATRRERQPPPIEEEPIEDFMEELEEMEENLE
jgi:type II secretory pathway component PulC